MNILLRDVPRRFNRNLIMRAIQFYGSQLMTSRLLSAIDIEVTFVRNLYDKEGGVGFCQWEDDNHRPREFTILVDHSLEHEETLSILAHEMVHVKQWARSEMKTLSKNLKWQGRVDDWDDMGYDNLPWEREAVEKEVKLLELFLAQD